MSSVASRTFVSTPKRDAGATWTAIVDFLTRKQECPARTELLSISGIAASLIADQAPKDDAIVITCDGPRTRIYCIYDDDAITESDANEDPIGFDPLRGNWCLSLPCLKDDLAWVQNALRKCSARITARELGDNIAEQDKSETRQENILTLDPKGFLGS
jgi:hypothetical protein